MRTVLAKTTGVCDGVIQANDAGGKKWKSGAVDQKFSLHWSKATSKQAEANLFLDER